MFGCYFGQNVPKELDKNESFIQVSSMSFVWYSELLFEEALFGTGGLNICIITI